MTDNNFNIPAYVLERDNAVSSMDINKFRAFASKYAPPCYSMPPDDVLEIAMRKMAVHSTNIEIDIRVDAFRWLLERGFDFDL